MKLSGSAAFGSSPNYVHYWWNHRVEGCFPRGLAPRITELARRDPGYRHLDRSFRCNHADDHRRSRRKLRFASRRRGPAVYPTRSGLAPRTQRQQDSPSPPHQVFYHFPSCRHPAPSRLPEVRDRMLVKVRARRARSLARLICDA